MKVPESLKQKLERLVDATSSQKVLVGFDGYVDLIQKAVKSAKQDGRVYFDSITDMSTHIAAAAGKSAQIELRTVATKMGGNAPILSHSLGKLGVQNYCMGMMGDPEVSGVFAEMHSNCTLLSIGPPAATNALEFTDGKIILSEVSPFDVLDLEYIIRKKGFDFIVNPLRECKVISMVDWSNLPRCTQLWERIYELISTHQITDKIFFFDLCDPSKRTSAEVREVLQVISRFSSHGKTVLGLNENEALKVFRALSEEESTTAPHLTYVCTAIFQALSVDILLVHPVDRSIVVTKEGVLERMGKVITQPKILTGGGDNMNAGFCFGLLNDFTVEECMFTGMATSGAYVQNGYSPTVQELLEFMK